MADIWGNLVFSTGNALESLGSSFFDVALHYRFRRNNDGDGKLSYVPSCGYATGTNAVEYTVRRIVRQEIYARLNNLAKDVQQSVAAKRLEKYREKQQTLSQAIVQRGEAVHKNYGKLKLNDSDIINAQDIYGSAVDGALIIWYDGENELQEIIETRYSEILKKDREKYNPLAIFDKVTYTNGIKGQTYHTKKVFIIDLAPKITIQSSKNIVLTKVQGRDYTRKELISGGDLCFAVTGEINSNYADVYPSHDVQKFINIMQHNGIVMVNNVMFDQFNVNKILIKDFSLGTPTCHNVQPYSFTCIAVEPDEMQVTIDTIQAINQVLTSTSGGWERLLLNDKLGEILDNKVTSLVIDKLISNI